MGGRADVCVCRVDIYHPTDLRNGNLGSQADREVPSVCLSLLCLPAVCLSVLSVGLRLPPATLPP